MPEHAELAALLRRGVPQLLHPGQRVVDAEVLVVAGESLTKPPGRSWNTMKFSMMSSRRSFVHMPRITVSSETTPSSPSELIFFHSEKNSHPDVIVPTFVSAPFERTMKPFGANRCGIASR